MTVAAAIHGHLGVLAAVALLHPALLLWRGAPLSRRGRWAVSLSTLITSAAFGLGVAIYEAYRADVRRELYREAPAVALLFETKEHLAFAVICLALGGLACALLAPDRSLRVLAARLYLAASLACAIVVSLGTLVAATRGFGS
ncbi:hypothetical protein ARNL5_03437 [Anaerolineae bacterium]|nr:hypothetical protein ARNL5_03437 [Anaerolineae bacterium]